MPAVVLKTSFRYKWDIGGFLDYMERPEAFSNNLSDKKSEYYDYLEYMGNEDKSDGLFSASKDLLDTEDKAQLRQLEISALSQGCPKYLGVISFDNNYLKQNGWIVGDKLDKDKLKDCARKAITAMINASDKLEADNVVWVAAIHTNTDNVHIHFQLIEKERREDRRVTYKGKGQDKLETAAFERLKSTVLSDTLTRKQTPIITEIERKILVPSIGEKFTPTASINALMHDLPETKKAWQYGRSKMQPYRQRIKACVDEIIESDSELSKQFDDYKSKLENMSRQYRELYGKREDGRTPIEEYTVNHLDDFYNAAGNKLLQEIYKLKYEDDAHDPTMTKKVKKAAAPNLIKEKNRNLRSNAPIPEDSDPVDESDTYEYEKTEHEKQNISDNRKGYKLDWSKEYKKAQKIIYNRNSTADDIKTAEKILLAESGKGNALATFALGKLYSTEKHGTKDETKSYQYYELALTAFRELEKTDKQKPYLQYRIGKMYQYGLGTETDYIEAHDWFERSANQNNKYAQFSLANMYYYGTGVEQDSQKAFEWYERSYQQGMPYAAYALGQMYSRGQYVDNDDEKAQKCYKEALQGFLNMETDAADDNLLYKIGQMYRDGKGTKSDIAKALKYFERSAELNNVNAQRIMGVEYVTGENIAQDIPKGLKMLTALAGKKDTLAAYKLGQFYKCGEYIEKDLDKAEKYLLLAEENELAMYSLGKLYLTEEKKDIGKAAHYFEKACEKPSIRPFAAYTYAKLLLDDTPIHNSGKAVKLLVDNAADNDQCAYLLGKLYLFGTKEIQKNIDAAEQWLKYAAGHENKNAAVILERGIRKIYARKAFRNAASGSQHIMDRCAGSIERLLRESEAHLKALQNEYEYNVEQHGMFDEYEREY